MDVLDFLLSVACLSAVVVAHGTHQQGHEQHNILKDRNQVHDQAHIMEHMDGIVTKPEEEMTDQELQFHYFKMHDYDHNNMLDGIELISAITHYHKADEEDPNHAAPPPVLPESQMTSMIDTILKEEDHNNDGYISYVEFIKAQRSSEEPPPTSQPTS